LLTAVGTIITALTNRLGRAVDRRRILEERPRSLAAQEAAVAYEELGVLARRIRLIYFSTMAAVLCALFVCLLVAGAFVGAFISVDLSKLVGLLFILAMLALISCLILLLREVFLAVTGPRHVIR